MNRSDKEITNALTKALSRMTREEPGKGYELSRSVPERMDRRYSFLFRFHAKKPDGSSESLLVKIPHEEWMRSMEEAIESRHLQEVVQEEFVGLSAIKETILKAGEENLYALSPITVLKEFNALVMEEKPIRMLKSYLNRAGIILGREKEWQDFEKKLALAGKWLKAIHSHFAGAEDLPLKKLNLEASIEAEFKAMEKYKAGGLESLLSRFRSFLDGIKDEPVRLTCLHNDFQLGNIFITNDGKVGALDPNWIINRYAYKDLATVLIDPLTRKVQVLSSGLAFRRTQQKRYEKAIMGGYSGEDSTNFPLLDFFCATAALNKWRQDEEELWNVKAGLKKAGSFLIRPAMRSYFHKLIRSYLERGMEEAKKQ